ncbi:hypothetical protein [uncultured Aquimarina sp.]|uniref:hypothetical protein n=1 Tax=uncultured Aquimarina sp. TaxID=575652 RepID=UPI0026190F8E|nr:hypothetical protein [uncultured Aquimarina sp.]
MKKNCRKKIINCIIVVVISGCANGQKSNFIVPCKIQEITSDFYLENSPKTYSLDDMIYRNPGLFMAGENNFVDYDNGMFFFGSNFGLSEMNLDKCNNSYFLKETVSKIKLSQREKRLDSVSKLKLETIDFNKINYKIIKNTTVRFLYIGRLDIPFIQNDKFLNRNLPVFMIISLTEK